MHGAARARRCRTGTAAGRARPARRRARARLRPAPARRAHPAGERRRRLGRRLPGQRLAAYSRSRRRSTRTGTTARPDEASPNDWSPGAPLLYAGVYYVTGGVHAKAALLLRRAAGHGHDPAHVPDRRAASPGRSPACRRRCSPPPTRRSSRTTSRLLAEPVALFWLPAGDARLPVGVRRRAAGWRWLAPGALLGLTTLTRPEYLPFVAAVRAARAACGCGVGDRARACSPGSSPRLLLVVAAFAACSRPGPSATCIVARPLRAGHDRRRQGAVRRHLPPGRRPPAAGQARS